MMTIPEETTAYDQQCAGEALETLEKILRFYIADRRERALEALTLYFAAVREGASPEDIRPTALIELPITAAEVEAAQR